MPIKGLTTDAAFPQIGSLRKGAPKPNERTPGRDLKHFRFVPDEGNPDLDAVFAEKYGDAPDRLVVFLPYPTADECFEAYFEEYVAGGLIRRCDGATCILWQQQDGTYSDAAKDCEAEAEETTTNAAAPCQCKAAGRLHVILPELEEFATVCVHTTSKNDIRNLARTLRICELFAQQSGGDLTAIPFLLYRKPTKISTPGEGGKRVRRTSHLLAIKPHKDWVARQLEAAKERALLGDGGALPAPEAPQLTAGAPVEIGGVASRRADEVEAAARMALESASPTEIKELQTLCSDYGFSGDTRALRIDFGERICQRTLGSFSACTSHEAERISSVLEQVMQRLRDPGRRLEFARFCRHQGLALEDDLHVFEALGDFAEALSDERPDDGAWKAPDGYLESLTDEDGFYAG